MLPEDVLLAVLLDLYAVRASLEQERQAGPGQQVDAAGGVLGVGLEEVQVVELAEALVDAAADAAEGDDVNAGGLRAADPVDGLAEVGGLLVGVVDDLGGVGLGRVEVADRGR